MPAAPGESEPGDGGDSPKAYQQIGPPLFPFYDHYIRRSDGTEVLNLLYLYRSTSNPEAGSSSKHVFPFFYTSSAKNPPDRRLYLYPLLYFHRHSEAETFNYLVPLFFDRRTPTDSWQFLTPVWLRHHDIAAATTSNHFLFPLSRFRADRSDPAATVSGFRLGLPVIAELFEAYNKADTTTRLSFLSTMSFREEASSSWAIFHRESSKSSDGRSESRTHFFPLVWHRSAPDSRYFHLLPLVFTGGSATSRFDWYLPFWGRSTSPATQDTYLPFILSRFGRSGDGGVRRDILWPLYHREFGPEYSSFYSLPLFNYSWTPEVRSWRILQVLYGNEYYPQKEKTAHSFLWPLGRHDVDPDGVTGHVRFLPLYFDDFDADRRHRITPLFYNYQQRSGTTVDYNFTFALPDYFGWGPPDDYFGFGFPLYWKSRSGRTGWDLFLPIYFSFFRSSAYGVSVFPLVTYNSYPSEKQLLLGGPAFVHRRFKDHEGAHEGSATSIAWPLTSLELRRDGYHVRLLPLGWVSRRGDDRDLLLFPLWYRQWGGTRSQNYLFALYGRYESETVERDFYALGSYVHSREKDAEGEWFRDRKDALWSLFSMQHNTRTQETHQRFLPLGYWRSTSVPEDRTIAGPLFYSHRVEGKDDKTHFLDLVLGNVFVAKDVYRAAPAAARVMRPAKEGAEAEAAPPSEATSEGPETATPTETAEAAPVAPPVVPPTPPSEVDLVSRERGVLWPFLRWGEDRDTGIESKWLLPLLFDRKTREGRTRALFPLAFWDEMGDRYSQKYFRYFFLANWEHWDDGYRVSFGQLLADYMRDESDDSRRWRFLYPLTEFKTTSTGYSYQFTPLLQGSANEDGGQRVSSHFLFPLYWFGGTSTQQKDESYETESEHFYLFPLYGVNRKSLRTQRDYLIPFIHTEHGMDSYKFQLRPFFFLRNDPEELSVRLWPLHSFESGEAAGDWWVSKYVFLSKHAVRRNRWSYRLDPFLFRTSKTEDSFGIGGLFELFAYDTKGAGVWTETSFRALPFLYGYSRQKEGAFWTFPFYYEQDFGERPLETMHPARFFFLVNHLRGASGERLTSVLWKMAEYLDNPRRPEYHEFRLLYALYQDIKDISFRQLAMQPFFFYSSDETDPLRPEKTLFILPALGYRKHEVSGRSTHYLLWFVPVWWS